jgi:hypothetical protein
MKAFKLLFLAMPTLAFPGDAVISVGAQDGQTNEVFSQLLTSSQYANLLFNDRIDEATKTKNQFVKDKFSPGNYIQISNAAYEVIINSDNGCLVSYTCSDRINSSILKPTKKISDMADLVKKYVQDLKFIKLSGISKFNIDIDMDHPLFNNSAALVLYSRIHDGIPVTNERIGVGFDFTLDRLIVRSIQAVVSFGPIPDHSPPAVTERQAIEYATQSLRQSGFALASLQSNGREISAIVPEGISVERDVYAHANKALDFGSYDWHTDRNGIIRYCYMCQVKISGLDIQSVYIDALTGDAVGAERIFH